MAAVLMYARNCVAYSLHHHKAAVIWNAEKDVLALYIRNYYSLYPLVLMRKCSSVFLKLKCVCLRPEMFFLAMLRKQRRLSYV